MIDLSDRRFLGLDLDGVFAPDIPWEQYLADMERTLAYRDTLHVLPTLPKFDRSRSVVITGRPIAEYERTRAWLDKNGFSEVTLMCRGPEHGGTKPEMAKFKAETMARLSCSDFFESEREQAEVIASIATKTAVYHWNADTAQAQLIRVGLCRQIQATPPTRNELDFELEAA